MWSTFLAHLIFLPFLLIVFGEGRNVMKLLIVQFSLFRLSYIKRISRKTFAYAPCYHKARDNGPGTVNKVVSTVTALYASYARPNIADTRRSKTSSAHAYCRVIRCRLYRSYWCRTGVLIVGWDLVFACLFVAMLLGKRPSQWQNWIIQSLKWAATCQNWHANQLHQTRRWDDSGNVIWATSYPPV